MVMTSSQAYGLAGQLNNNIPKLNQMITDLETIKGKINNNVVGVVGDSIISSINSRKQEIQAIISSLNGNISSIKSYAASLRAEEERRAREKAARERAARERAAKLKESLLADKIV